MNFSAILRAAGRRWYVLVAGVLATLALGYAALQIIPITYEARASFLLVPPSVNAESPDPALANNPNENPFLHLGGLDIVAGVLAKSLSDTDTAEQVVAEGSKDEYLVHPDDSVAGSVLEIVTTAGTEKQAFAMLDELLDLAKTRLADLQTAVAASPNSQITMMVITDNTVATPNTSTVVRTLIVVMVVGLALTLILAITVDSMVRRWKDRPGRRARDHRRPTAPSDPESPSDPTANQRIRAGTHGAKEALEEGPLIDDDSRPLARKG